VAVPASILVAFAMIVRAVETMTRFVPVSMHRHLEEEADVYDLCFVKVWSQLLAGLAVTVLPIMCAAAKSTSFFFHGDRAYSASSKTVQFVGTASA
jgi:hypothetical protein